MQDRRVADRIGGGDMTQTRNALLAYPALSLAIGTNGAAAEKKYDLGATDNEIKIGNIMPYSGPLSAYALIGRTEAAYINKINAEGGVNGRKINFITYDDAFSPPKTVEQARKLVESDAVASISLVQNIRRLPAVLKLFADTQRLPE
jgi:branched-chain amino acid transport system substrate-binding protein